jgi:fucose 4-O-acetylase-like acetyltransferase
MSSPKLRLPWIDNLRTLVILLVVSMHACVTYSHVGDWYVTAEKVPTLPEKLIFVLWQAHLQSFFMGLLFFVSGCFVHGALERRGPAAFVRERCVRLGLPALFYMLVIHPFILLGLNPWHADFPPFGAYYARYLTTGRFLGSSGPLWFAFALLIFCAVLATWRKVRPVAGESTPDSGATVAPGAGTLWALGLLLGGATFVMRLVQPLGTNVLNFQLGYFVQYIAAFAAGVAAARMGWLLPLAASPQARRAGGVALVAGPLLLLALFVALVKFPAAGDPPPHQGGWHWQSLALSFWEQLTGLGLALGLLAYFSRRMNRESPVSRWLADRSFGVYLLHAPVLVALMMAFRSLPQNPLPLAGLLTVTGLVVSFALADLARRVPGLRAIL